MRKSSGFASLLVILGLLFIGLAIPATVKLVEKNQENRKMAADTDGGGGSCGQCQRSETKQECHKENRKDCVELKDGDNCTDEEYNCRKQVQVCDRYNIALPTNADDLLGIKEAVRLKYGLPQNELRYENPLEYERQLLAIAEKNGIEVRASEDPIFAPLQQKVKQTIGLTGGPMSLGPEDTGGRNIVIYPFTKVNAVGRNADFAHELCHGLQSCLYPRMPIEQQEAEAYILTYSPSMIKENPYDAAVDLVGRIGGSVRHYYNEQILTGR